MYTYPYDTHTISVIVHVHDKGIHLNNAGVYYRMFSHIGNRVCAGKLMVRNCVFVVEDNIQHDVHKNG